MTAEAAKHLQFHTSVVSEAVGKQHRVFEPARTRSPTARCFVTLLRDLSLYSIHTPSSWEIRLAIRNFPTFHRAKEKKPLSADSSY